MSVTELLNDPAFRTIVDRFVSEVPSRVQSLWLSLDQDRYCDAKHLAHQLKGAGGSFGFPAITTAAAGVESRCALQDKDGDLADAMQRLDDVCQEAIADWSASGADV